MRLFKTVAAALALLIAAPAAAQTPAWNPQPWVEDLAQIRAAMDAKYANLDWLLTERELDLPGLFERAERAVNNAGSDAAAGAVGSFLRITRTIFASSSIRSCRF